MRNYTAEAKLCVFKVCSSHPCQEEGNGLKASSTDGWTLTHAHTAHTTGVDAGDLEDSSLWVQLNGVNVTLCIVSWLVALNYCFQCNEVAVLGQQPSHVAGRPTQLPAHTTH